MVVSPSGWIVSPIAPVLALDGDIDTHWSAGDFPSQWIEVVLGPGPPVVAVRLTVSQYPDGFTRHVLLGRLASGELVRLAELAGTTADQHVLELLADEPWNVVGVRVETLESPSWVACFEIEVIRADA